MVIGGDHGYGAVGSAQAADDRAEYFGEFRADHEKSFGIAFRRCDL